MWGLPNEARPSMGQIVKKREKGNCRQVVAFEASAHLGLKPILIDSQALDFCIEGRIGDAQLSGGACWP